MTDRRLSFEKISNIRDLGGLQTSDGKKVKSGKLIRSGHLSLMTESDKEKFAALVGTVVDFRTDMEREEKPDVKVFGVDYMVLPILDSVTPGITKEDAANMAAAMEMLAEPGHAKDFMTDLYRTFVTDDFALAGYERFAKLVATPHDKAILWHCTAGKDRAGMGAVIVEEILGVNRDEIIEDYLMTNDFMEPERAMMEEIVVQMTGSKNAIDAKTLDYFSGAYREYIDAFYASIEAHYGSFEGFVKEALKLTDEDISRMKELYLG